MVFKFTLAILVALFFFYDQANAGVCDDLKGAHTSQFHPSVPRQKYGVELDSDDDEFSLPKCLIPEVPLEDIPEEFDSRKQWPECENSLWEIRNQGVCASCWAFAVTEVMTDRYCIANKGQKQFRFSAYDLLSCGMDEAKWNLHEKIKGCKGGNVAKTWNYTARVGVVSGGSFNEGIGCRSYEIPPCEPNDDNCGESSTNSGIICNKTCNNPKYNPTYESDLIKPKNPCRIERGNATAIQIEIMRNGPVVAVMRMSSDFEKYMNIAKYDDVFIYDPPSSFGINHAVKLLGWGQQIEPCGRIAPYWLAANSFGDQWGSQKGFFKIYRITQDIQDKDKETANHRSSCIDQAVSLAYF